MPGKAIIDQHVLCPCLGSRNVCVAVLDGRVDLEHRCFRGANLTLLPSSIPTNARSNGPMAAHGTHIASVIFGQPNSAVEGLAPHCSGLIIPVFCDDRRSVSQLDLARGIELAVDYGARIINISAGELTDAGEADAWLHNAIRLCADRNVLEEIAVFVHRAPLDRDAVPNGGDRALQPGAAIDDEEFGPLQAALDELIDHGGPG